MNKNTIIILSCILSVIEGALLSNIIRFLANERAIPLVLILLTFGIGAFIVAGILTVTNTYNSGGKTFIDTSWGDKCVEDIKDRWANIPLEEFTCYECPTRNDCRLVDDPYNTSGYCLAMK
jgi:hypothetical protein